MKDDALRRIVLDELNDSKYVHKGVLLAFDKGYDVDGTALPVSSKGTQMYTPNDYVADICRMEQDEGSGKAFFGASVHPDRSDALYELERVKEMGAVLVKWIPSAQMIDPSLERFVPFYEKLRELKLPLLCHTGKEHTLKPARGNKAFQAFNDPSRLRLPLQQGVTVVACHAALPLHFWEKDTSNELWTLFDESVGMPGELLVDTAAFVSLVAHRVKKARKFIQKAQTTGMRERFFLGSDYPLPIWISKRAFRGSDAALLRQAKDEKNTLDRNVLLQRALGLSDASFAGTGAVLNIR